jgi:hypothetical protein
VVAIAGLAALASVVIGFSSGGAGAAGAETTQLAVGMAQWVPCAAGGAGELVSLSGTLHVTTHTVQRSATEWVTTTDINPQGVVGTGQVTGDTYRGTGHTGSTFVSNASGERMTQTNNFRLIGPGPGNNLVAHANWHTTTLADGSVAAQVDNVSLECR